MELLIKKGLNINLDDAHKSINIQTPGGCTISLNDQQLTREVCYSSDLNSDYQVGDDFSIYDLNGEYNGGTYHVMFFDMSATW